MCLSTIAKKGQKSEKQPIVAYKVFGVTKSGKMRGLYYKGIGTHKDGYKTGFVYKSHELEGMCSSVSNRDFNPMLDVYHLGFHCFQTIGGARDYIKNWADQMANPCVIRRVKVWGKITWGHQLKYKVVVGEHMRIGRKVK